MPGNTKGMELANKNLLVVGLARSGLTAANFLIGRGANVTVTDLKSENELSQILKLLSSPVRLSLGEHRKKDFIEADTIVLSPGVPRSIGPIQKAVSAGVEVISEVELAYRFLLGVFVGVTGSNGKTTTTTLIGRILQEARRQHVVAGNIGTPLTSFIDDPSINQKNTIFVVELSSFQLESIVEFRCQIALLLNVTPDHMDRYSDFRAYRTAKGRIFRNQIKDDLAVINADDSNSQAAASLKRSRTFPFSSQQTLQQGAFLKDRQLIVSWEGQELRMLTLGDIQLRGEHNLENVLAASSTAYLLGVPPAAIAKAVREFPGVEHRLEWVRRYKGVDYYNDSKATNVESAIRAIQAFADPLILIMGGLDKGTDFTPLRTVMSRNVKQVFLLGKASKKIASTIGDLVDVVATTDLAEAVDLASRSASSGSIVLLVPACSSFDMFRNYEARGRAFRELVHALSQSPTEQPERTETR